MFQCVRTLKASFVPRLQNKAFAFPHVRIMFIAIGCSVLRFIRRKRTFFFRELGGIIKHVFFRTDAKFLAMNTFFLIRS